MTNRFLLKTKNGGKWARLTALLVVLLITTVQVMGQVLIEENFENYTVGNKIAVESATAGHSWWTTWSNNPGSTEDGVVANFNATKCGHLTYNNDQVLLCGGIESGSYDLEFDILVPTGKDGYFNILHNFSGSNSTWAMQAYLHLTNDGQTSTSAPGHGTIHAGSIGTADIPAVYDEWMHFRLHVDTDLDTAKFFYSTGTNPEQCLCKWRWSYDSFGEGIVGKKLDAMDFFPPESAAKSEFYLDNFKLTRSVAEVFNAGGTSAGRYSSVQEAINNVTTGQTVKLLADIDLTATVNVASGKNFTLDLNGHILNGSNLTGDNASLIYSNGTLNIIDGNPAATHATPFDTIAGAIMTGGKGSLYGQYPSGGAVFSLGTLSVDGIAFVNNTAKQGAAIYFNGGNNIVKHCRFYGNSSPEYRGSAVYMENSCQCAIDSCVFKGNYGKSAILYITGLSSATIAHTTFTNNSSWNYPGAIGVWNGNLMLNDGTVITNNTSDASFPCGGVYVWKSSQHNNTIAMSGKVIIKDNTANGKPANLCLSGDPLCDVMVLNGMSAGSEVHVSTLNSNDEHAKRTFASNATQADLPYFVSDAAYGIFLDNGKLATKDTLNYLHFVSLKEGCTVRLDKAGEDANQLTSAQLEYSIDNRQSWSNYTWNNTTGASVAFANAGDTIWFRAGQNGTAGTNATFSEASTKYYQFAFGANDSVAAGGNIMSLYDGSCQQTTMKVFGFCKLFNNCKALTTAPLLPATQLASSCYAYMFYGCSLLLAAPLLPATTLANTCYSTMFANCTSLSAAPALPAPQLLQYCYMSMFKGCTSLTTAPSLQATKLADYCYTSMFQGCTSLRVDTCNGTCGGAFLVVPNPATTPTNWNKNMFFGCEGDAKYTAQYGIKLGGHYCISENVETYTVTATANDPTMGTVTGSGTYPPGTSVTLTATPAANHHFVSWSDGSTDNPYNFTLTQDTTLTATFAYNCDAQSTVTDQDGNSYHVVSIGGLCWTKENLRTLHYMQDGSAVPSQAIYCSDNNPDTVENLAIYGRFYSWYSSVKVPEGDDNAVPATDALGNVQGICPNGWHLPSQAEFDALTAHSASEVKSATTWMDAPGTNTTGFSALAAGYYNGLRFEDMGGNAYFWSSTHTVGSHKTHCCSLVFGCHDVLINDLENSNKVNVRCVHN